jgi:hypothetical protein
MSNLKMQTSNYGMKVGNPGIRSVGAITFGPDGVLFVADNREAKIFAIGVDDDDALSASPVALDRLATRLGSYLGCGRDDVTIRGMAVHPLSHAVYLSVMRGPGDAAQPVLVRIASNGSIGDLALQDVAFSEVAIKDAPAVSDPRKEGRLAGKNEGEEMTLPNGRTLRVAWDSLRTVTITDLKYLNGMLIVAGASNEEFSSTLRRVPFPFTNGHSTNSIEIFHVSHGKYETHSPIRSFVPYGGGVGILASYTCTPLVHFSLSDVMSDGHMKGRTVAELGAMNTPLDMVAFERDGEDYVLVSNSSHGLFKIAIRDVEAQRALTETGGPEGVPRSQLPHKGVGRMAIVGNSVLMIQADGEGDLHLRPYDCATI